jgi:hypothetical protein
MQNSGFYVKRIEDDDDDDDDDDLVPGQSSKSVKVSVFFFTDILC